MSMPVLPYYEAPVMTTPNVTPFSLRDGDTMLKKIDRLRKWVNAELVPFVNENFADQRTYINSEINKLVVSINAHLSTYDEKVDNYALKVNELETFVNNRVNEIINNAVTVQGEVVNGVVAPFMVYATNTRYPGLNVELGAKYSEIAASVVDGTTLKLAPGIYNQTTPMNVFLNGRNLKLDFSGVKPVRNLKNFVQLNIVETYDALKNVTFMGFENAVIDGQNVAVTTLSYTESPGYVKGDRIKIVSDDAIPGSRQDGATEFPRMGEHFVVYLAAGNTVKVYGIPVEFWEYKTNIRTAKMGGGSVEVIGGEFNVTDAMTIAENRAPAVIRFQGIEMPRLIGTRIKRAVGPAIQFRSCFGYLAESCKIDWAMNDQAETHGYGIHDSNSQNGTIVNCIARFTRHGFADKSVSIPVNSGAYNDASNYGRTLFASVSMSVYHSSSTALDAHHESYGNHYHDCYVKLADVTSETMSLGLNRPSGIGLRGKNHKISDCYISGGESAISIVTETPSSNFKNGETRGVDVSNVTIENCTFAFYANVRTGSHEFANIQDPEKSMTIRGVTARNVRAIVGGNNFKISISDSEFELSKWPAQSFLGGSGCLIELNNVVIDGTKFEATNNTSSAPTLHRLISISNGDSNANPSNSIASLGTVYFKMNDALAAMFTDYMVRTGSRSEIFFPNKNSLIFDKTIPGKVWEPNNVAAPTSTRAVMGWSMATSRSTGSKTNSGYALVTGAAVANADSYKSVTFSPNENLLITIIPDGPVTFPKLEIGRYVGQRLTILVNNAQPVTFTSSSANYGTVLRTTTKVVNNDSIEFYFTGSVWRER